MSTSTVDFNQRVTLGRTGLRASRLGIGASYGVGANDIERAYNEKGINLFYWGSVRRESFGEGIRRLARRNREDLVIVIQSYSRIAGLISWSLERALRSLRLDHADVLLLGMFNHPPSARILEAAQRLRDSGKVRLLAVSCHRRPTFRQYIQAGVFDILMFRYNAAHRGAEVEVLPHLAIPIRPGTIAYTATRWGDLLNPAKIRPGEKKPSASDCYRFALSRYEVDVCMTGPANSEQLSEALLALEKGPMDSEELDWMRRVGDYIHRRRPGIRARVFGFGEA